MVKNMMVLPRLNTLSRTSRNLVKGGLLLSAGGLALGAVSSANPDPAARASGASLTRGVLGLGGAALVAGAGLGLASMFDTKKKRRLI